MYLLILIVIGLLVSLITSYYFSASTVIYALMRNKVDNTAIDDIYIYREEPKFEPTPAEDVPDEDSSSEKEGDSSAQEQ